MLEIRVGREREALLLTACGIETDKVARDILHLGLRLLLEPRPGSGSEFAYLGRHTLLAPVFRELVERMDAHEHNVVVLEKELYHLLRVAVDISLHQTSEFGYAVVDMHDIVAGLDLLELLEAEGEFAATRPVALEVVFMETVEDLMVGEKADALPVVDESLMDGVVDRRETDTVAAVFEYGFQTVGLERGIAEYQQPVVVCKEFCKRIGNQVEIFVI